MSKKNPPPDEPGFGSLEDDFFNQSPAGWEEEAAPGPVTEELAKAAARPGGPKGERDGRRKAEDDRRGADATQAERKAADGRHADPKRAQQESKRAAAEARLAEAARQAELEAEARRAARQLGDQATRVLHKRSREEILAEEDAIEAAAQAAKAASVAPPPPPELPAPAAPAPAEDPIEDAPTMAAPAVQRAPEVVPEEPTPPPIPSYVPASTERDAWAEVVDALAAAAANADPAGRLDLLVGAAHFARVRCIDPARAMEILAQGMAFSPKPASFWKERALAAGKTEDANAARESWAELAAASRGEQAMEAALEGIRVVRDSEGSRDLALAELRRLAGAHPGDPAVLAALLEAQRAASDLEGEAESLAGLAAHYAGAAAGATHLARAEVLVRLGRVADAVEAAQAARAADPSSAAAFLLLERSWRAAGEWASLAGLYEAEAERLSGGELGGAGADVAFWLARAARVYRHQRFDEKKAAEAYARALAAADSGGLRREYDVFCAETERWEELAASLRVEVAAAAGPARSFLSYRLGTVLEERLRRPDDALAAYRAAAEAPAAAPAAEAVLRLLQARGDHAGLVAFLAERVERLTEPSLVVTAYYRMGEACEGPLGDLAGARKHFERVLDVAPGYLPALEALDRVYTRLAAWPDLAAVYEQRAILAEEPAAVALQRHRAGAVYEFRLSDIDRAMGQYALALEAVPDFPPSLDAYVRVLEAAGDWAAVAAVLRRAAHATRDDNEAVSLSYRAARVLADRTPDLAGAMACLQLTLEHSPGFRPAVLLLKELAARQGDWSEYFRLERAQADQGEDRDRRTWRLAAAAEAAARLPEVDPGPVLREIFREDPHNAAAVDLAERSMLVHGETASLVREYMERASHAADAESRARAGARAAELALESGDAAAVKAAIDEVLAAEGVAARPVRALARVAEGLGYPEDALRALGQAGMNGIEAARLRLQALGDASGAASGLAEALEDGEGPEHGDAAAAAALLRVSRDHAPRARAHAVLAARASSPAARAMHALAAAPGLLAAGEEARALAMSWAAFEGSPRPGRALDALRAALVAAKDADGLRRAYAMVSGPAQADLAEALEECGDLAGAVAAAKAQSEGEPSSLRWSLVLERLQAQAGDWRGVFETLDARLATSGEAAQEQIAAKCRWLLAEKLAESEEAWTFYRTLHEQRPGDREVLEALARIAGARGETALAVQYLDELSAASGDAATSARFQRRRAEALEGSGELEAARAAFTRALDYQADDPEALLGLRRLSEKSGDWRGVVGILARQAALATGQQQVGLYAEIARTWEEKLQEPRVAADAWRRVHELAPGDAEALRHLVAASESGRDWAGFVEFAQALIPALEGEERATLQRRAGAACADHLRRDDDAIRFLEAAATATPPDLDAARLLEKIHSGRGDWRKVVQALTRRATAATDPAEKVDALARAARTQAETLQDRAAAASTYAALLAVAPDHADALRFRGAFLFEEGDLAAALGCFEPLDAIESGRDYDDFDVQIEAAMYYYRFAETLRAAGRAAESVRRYERALELNSTHLPSLESLGTLYMERLEWTRAEKIYRQLLQLTGGLGQADLLAETYASLGIVELRLGHPDRARKRFSKTLETKPNHIPALKGMAESLADAAEWNTLLNVYNNVIYHTQDPADVVEAYLAKGHVLDAKLNLADKAGQHYRKLLTFDERQPTAHARLGELALRGRDWASAAKLAEEGLALEPERQDVCAALHLCRAIACQALGDGAAAQEDYRQALQADRGVVADVGPQGIEDYDKAHEALRNRIQSGKL